MGTSFYRGSHEIDVPMSSIVHFFAPDPAKMQTPETANDISLDHSMFHYPTPANNPAPPQVVKTEGNEGEGTAAVYISSDDEVEVSPSFVNDIIYISDEDE